MRILWKLVCFPVWVARFWIEFLILLFQVGVAGRFFGTVDFAREAGKIG